jgi:hypothetical protein
MEEAKIKLREIEIAKEILILKYLEQFGWLSANSYSYFSNLPPSLFLTFKNVESFLVTCKKKLDV